MKTVYGVHAGPESEGDRQIVGIYTTQAAANKRLRVFKYGFVIEYPLDEPIPYNPE